MFDYAERRRRLAERLDAEGVAALFLAPSADLEYLTGVERQIPNFGEASYAHGWVTGAFFRPGAEPVFVLPRMFAAFDLREQPEGELIVVNETDDGARDLRARRARARPATGVVAVGDRVWAETTLELGAHRRRRAAARPARGSSTSCGGSSRAEELEAMGRAIATVEATMAATAPLVVPGVSMAELAEAVEHELRVAGSRCPSFTTHIFTGLGEDDFDSGEATARRPIPRGHLGDVRLRRRRRRLLLRLRPHDLLRRAARRLPRGLRGHARRAGGRAAPPRAAGTPAREVNAACRRPIEEAGLGEHFRHRMGHGIGMDVHERPFISSEDETPLEPGMTFTDEPSIIIPGRYSLRIEDIVVCEEGGGRKLNSYPAALVANG